jgi:hypothetical protein
MAAAKLRRTKKGDELVRGTAETTLQLLLISDEK